VTGGRGQTALLVITAASLALTASQSLVLARLVRHVRAAGLDRIPLARRGKRRPGPGASGAKGGLVRPVSPVPPQDPHAQTGSIPRGRTHIA
jgi:hypothetical protein